MHTDNIHSREGSTKDPRDEHKVVLESDMSNKSGSNHNPCENEGASDTDEGCVETYYPALLVVMWCIRIAGLEDEGLHGSGEQ